MTRRISACLGLLLLILAGCAQKAAEKRYPMQGEVKADAEFAKLHVGDRIEATVVVSDPAYYVTDVKVAPK